MSPFDRRWSPADAVTLACVMEAAAAKVGNVHPGRAFAATHFGHFAASAVAIRSSFATPPQSVGQLVLNSVQQTLDAVGSNTNLGMLLLFAPLVMASNTVQPDQPLTRLHLQQLVSQLLNQLTADDATLVYEAIRRAHPGGLGTRRDANVQDTSPPFISLRDAMQQVASFDAVARQYTNDYADIFQRLLPWFDDSLHSSRTPLEAIERLHLRSLAHEPDGLIFRKSGHDVALSAQRLAQQAFQAVQQWDLATCDSPGTSSAAPVPSIALLPEVIALDTYLRADGNRRNPGTTADLISATLYVHLVAT